jgi:hypothetical protein
MLDRMITSDLAFLLPITTLMIIGMIIVFILDLTEKRSRRKQLRLPFNKKHTAR